VARVLLDQVNRQFGTTTALESISFEVPDGQFWVLVGPSGCGKSTILRMIAGLDNATTGAIYIGERQVNQVPARLRDVAMVFQNYALYPHMTVAENLAFGLRMRGSSQAEIQPQVATVADALNIAHLLDRKPRQLSGGQQQRVALGRAIVRQPQVFLLDEPLSNLDAQLRDETRAELKQLHQRFGITTLYVTHDQVEAMTLADQIIVLNQGKIQQISDPHTLYRQPANQMVATFVGSPPMNILPARYDGSGFQLGDQSLACPASIQAALANNSDPTVNLGIRPEHLKLVDPGANFHLQATVTMIEPLGREVLVRVKLAAAAETVQVWTTPDRGLQVGEQVYLQFDLAHLFGFNPATGKNLLLP
jgi:multiple sugar transport system ATP-binding protein